MGERTATQLGFNTQVIYRSGDVTTPDDTEQAAKRLVEQGVDLILLQAVTEQPEIFVMLLATLHLCWAFPQAVKFIQVCMLLPQKLRAEWLKCL